MPTSLPAQDDCAHVEEGSLTTVEDSPEAASEASDQVSAPTATLSSSLELEGNHEVQEEAQMFWESEAPILFSPVSVPAEGDTLTATQEESLSLSPEDIQSPEVAPQE